MSETTASPSNGDTAEKCSDYTTKLLPQHVYLGRDREGYDHHLDRDANAAVRFTVDGRIERRTPLGDKHLDSYLAFVADEVGWETRKQAATWDFFPEGRR